MATKTKHYCDSCGKECPKEFLTVVQVSRAAAASTKPPQEFAVRPHDICGDCKGKFKKWVESFFG